MRARSLITGLLLALLLPLHGGDLADLSGAGTDAEQDKLSFSNTRRWDPEFLAFTRAKSLFLPADWSDLIRLPAPPANSSPRTRAELDHLLDVRSRRKEKRAEVRQELDWQGFRFGTHSAVDLFDAARRPATRRLLVEANHDLSIVVFTLKKRFNRVRPSTLDPELGTLFPVPGHPAYPSGHATQAFAFAYLLQELDPGHADAFRADALRIARNREIAGFHYPSDTDAGHLAARQLVDFLLANPDFKKLLAKAKKEW